MSQPTWKLAEPVQYVNDGWLPYDGKPIRPDGHPGRVVSIRAGEISIQWDGEQVPAHYAYLTKHVVRRNVKP